MSGAAASGETQGTAAQGTESGRPAQGREPLGGEDGVEGGGTASRAGAPAVRTEGALAQGLTAIDGRTRGDHRYLRPTDVCHFLGAYTARKGFAYSATNRLILDFKTALAGAGRRQRGHKEAAIATAAAALRQALRPEALDRAVFVPVPPSRVKGEAGYDDRLVRMLRAVRPERPLDVRELIVQRRSTEPSHRRTERLRPAEIVELYGIDEALEAPGARVVAVVDDLLTTGAHFRAAARALTQRYGDIRVVGLFLARRVLEAIDAEGADAVAAEAETETERAVTVAAETEAETADTAADAGSGGRSGSGARRRTAGVGKEAGSRKAMGPASTGRGDGGLKIVSVINYKGGVGKTTLTANLAAELASRGKRILALDMDAQCSLTFSFVTPDHWQSVLGGEQGEAEDRTIKKWFDGIVDDEAEVVPLDDLVLRDLKVGRHLGDRGGCLHLIPSHLGLINIDLDLAYMLSGVAPSRLHQRRARVYGQLRSHLNAYATAANYDYVLIDCPPNFNIVTKNAIVASDQIVIPAKPDYLSTLGIDYLLRSLGALVEEFNEDSPAVEIRPEILGVIFTMIQVLRGRPIGVQRQYMRPDDIAVPVFAATVRENKTIFGDAPEDGIPVVLERPRQEPYVTIVGEMASLADEFLERSGG